MARRRSWAGWHELRPRPCARATRARGRPGAARRAGSSVVVVSSRSLHLAALVDGLRVERALFHEAQVVAPRIGHVERALAPRSFEGLPRRLAVYLVWRERFERFG